MSQEHMKVVVAGAGSVGRFIAEQLVGNGHDVVIADSDRTVRSRHEGDRGLAGVRWVSGDACDVNVLRATELEQAEVIAAVTGDDEDNLVISLLSKQEFGVPRVIARVNNPKNEWMFNEMWGVDVSVSTPHLITGLVQEAVTIGSFVRLLAFEGGKAKLAEVTLANGSPAVGKEIMQLKFPRDATVVAILREGHVIVPRGDTVVREADEVLVLVTRDSEEEVRTILVGG